MFLLHEIFQKTARVGPVLSARKRVLQTAGEFHVAKPAFVELLQDVKIELP